MGATLVLLVAVSSGVTLPVATGSETKVHGPDWAATHCATSTGLRGQERALCSAYAYQQADAKLNALYRKLKSLSTPEVWKLQVEEERAWVKERDDHCKEEGGAEDKSLQDADGCLALMTNSRVKLFEERIETLSRQRGETPMQKSFAGAWTAWMCPAGGSARSRKVRQLRRLSLPEGRSALWCSHFCRSQCQPCR